MQQIAPSLQELLNHAALGEEMSYDDALAVRRHLRALRQEYKAILSDAAEDETRVWAIEHLMERFRDGEISVSECYNEVRTAYRTLNDHPRKSRILRAEIAFSMALSYLFSITCRISRNQRLDVACLHELLMQMDRTQQAFTQYHRFQAAQARKRERLMLQAAA